MCTLGVDLRGRQLYLLLMATKPTGKRYWRGFTLVELLVVVVVIAVLIGLILPAISGARKKANWTRCSSNLHQFSLAWMDFRYQNKDDEPGWLSTLYPDYMDSAELFICPRDRRKGKVDGSKPQELLDDHSSDAFNSTDDNWGNNDIWACSYFYEMSAAVCEYDGLGRTWNEVKHEEMDMLNVNLTTFPIIRCFHHWNDKWYSTKWVYLAEPPPIGSSDATGADELRKEGMTVNVAYAGNVFFAPENWRATIIE